jgi:hypothetical protein
VCWKKVKKVKNSLKIKKKERKTSEICNLDEKLMILIKKLEK